jgi:hypothetical protein
LEIGPFPDEVSKFLNILSPFYKFLITLLCFHASVLTCWQSYCIYLINYVPFSFNEREIYSWRNKSSETDAATLSVRNMLDFFIISALFRQRIYNDFTAVWYSLETILILIINFTSNGAIMEHYQLIPSQRHNEYALWVIYVIQFVVMCFHKFFRTIIFRRVIQTSFPLLVPALLHHLTNT